MATENDLDHLPSVIDVYCLHLTIFPVILFHVSLMCKSFHNPKNLLFMFFFPRLLSDNPIKTIGSLAFAINPNGKFTM